MIIVAVSKQQQAQTMSVLKDTFFGSIQICKRKVIRGHRVRSVERTAERHMFVVSIADLGVSLSSQDRLCTP